MKKNKKIEGQAMTGQAKKRIPINSEMLFKDDKELLIEHEGQQYRLRITRQNKLILTK